MFIFDLLTALIIATLLLLVPLYFSGRVGPWNGWLWFALVLFLFTWGGGAWVGPYGPTPLGFSWLAYLFFGLIFVLLMSSAVPPKRRRSKWQATEQTHAERE